jgi:hypothetical protein
VNITNASGWVSSSPATLTVDIPSGISTQPQSQGVPKGNNASFSVVPSGTAPFTYQWYLGTTKLGGGSTSSNLTLNSVQPTNAGNYTVVVNNNYGSITSAVATLTVYILPTITTQPQGQVVTAGQTASFSVAASGTAPLGYQWSINGTNIVGATNLSMSLNNVQTNNGGSYLVVITNLAGSVTSAVASLVVDPNTVLIDGDFGFGTTQTGAAVLGSPGDVWNTITNANGTLFSSTGAALGGIGFTLTTAAQFYLAVNGTPADFGTTNLMADYAFGYASSGYTPTISTSLTGLTLYTNSAFILVVYAAGNAAGQGGSLALNGATGGNTASNLTTTAASRQISAGQGVAYNIFYGILTNGTLTVTSTERPGQAFTAMNGFQLEFSPLPMITAQPASQTNAVGSAVSFTVGAFGNGILSYQWQAGPAGGPYTNLTDGGQITGSASNVLTISNLTVNGPGGYQVVVSNNSGSVTSTPALLTLSPQILTQPASQATFSGGSASFNVVASGSAPLSYQWYFNGSKLGGTTNGSTYTLTNINPGQAGNYAVVVLGAGGAVTSAVATVTVTNPVMTLSVGSGAGAGMTLTAFNFQLAVPVGVTYVVEASTNLLTWIPISTNVATSANRAIADTAATNFAQRYYRVKIP